VEPPAPPPSFAPPRAPGLSGTVQALLLALLLPAGLVAQVRRPIAGLVWTELFVFLAPAALAVQSFGLDGRIWLRFRLPAVRALALAPLLGAAGWFLGGALFAVARAVAPAPLVRAFDLSRLFDAPRGEQVALAAVAAILAPICEEIAFRGHLAASFRSRHGPAFAVGASAVVFALLHLDPLRAVPLLALGALYGWMALRSGSVWTAVAAHATNNAIAAGLALVQPVGAEPTEPTLGEALAGVALAAAALALAVAAYRTAVPAAGEPPVLPLRAPGTPLRFDVARVARATWLALLLGALAFVLVVTWR
jgi:membrane protease YdiL (CAAX protease family)